MRRKSSLYTTLSISPFASKYMVHRPEWMIWFTRLSLYFSCSAASTAAWILWLIPSTRFEIPGSCGMSCLEISRLSDRCSLSAWKFYMISDRPPNPSTDFASHFPNNTVPPHHFLNSLHRNSTHETEFMLPHIIFYAETILQKVPNQGIESRSVFNEKPFVLSLGKRLFYFLRSFHFPVWQSVVQ